MPKKESPWKNSPSIPACKCTCHRPRPGSARHSRSDRRRAPAAALRHTGSGTAVHTGRRDTRPRTSLRWSRPRTGISRWPGRRPRRSGICSRSRTAVPTCSPNNLEKHQGKIRNEKTKKSLKNHWKIEKKWNETNELIVKNENYEIMNEQINSLEKHKLKMWFWMKWVLLCVLY